MNLAGVVSRLKHKARKPWKCDKIQQIEVVKGRENRAGKGVPVYLLIALAVLNSVEHMVMDGDSCFVICFHRHPFRPCLLYTSPSPRDS